MCTEVALDESKMKEEDKRPILKGKISYEKTTNIKHIATVNLKKEPKVYSTQWQTKNETRPRSTVNVVDKNKKMATLHKKINIAKASKGVEISSDHLNADAGIVEYENSTRVNIMKIECLDMSECFHHNQRKVTTSKTNTMITICGIGSKSKNAKADVKDEEVIRDPVTIKFLNMCRSNENGNVGVGIPPAKQDSYIICTRDCIKKEIDIVSTLSQKYVKERQRRELYAVSNSAEMEEGEIADDKTGKFSFPFVTPLQTDMIKGECSQEIEDQIASQEPYHRKHPSCQTVDDRYDCQEAGECCDFPSQEEWEQYIDSLEEETTSYDTEGMEYVETTATTKSKTSDSDSTGPTAELGKANNDE